MRSAQKYIPHYAFHEWLHWEGRWELIDGVPIARSPVPRREHDRITAELLTGLTIALGNSGCKNCKAYESINYKIADDTILEPDVLIVCGKINRSYLDFPPVLIIEILSKSTEVKDRGIKYDYYERQGVKYYLIVDIKNKTIEVFELVDGKYHLQPFTGNYTFKLEADCNISPELNNVWED